MRSGGRGPATEVARADVRQEAPLRDQGRQQRSP